MHFSVSIDGIFSFKIIVNAKSLTFNQITGDKLIILPQKLVFIIGKRYFDREPKSGTHCKEKCC